MMKNSRSTAPIINILLIALLAEGLENFLHETTHATTAIAVGAQLKTFSFWAVDTGWLTSDTETPLRDGLIAGSAAIFNIVCAGISIMLFSRLKSHPLLRLFIFFFAAYSLFSGFGYLFIDPLFANEDSIGDWSKVVMLLGGGWDVRIPVCLVGALGTVYGYFWMGSAALRLVENQAIDPVEKRKGGLMLCILPYIIVNLVFSLLAIGHPLGIPGFVAMLLKLWFGFVGFFWAYMIKFVWIKSRSEATGEADSSVFDALRQVRPGLVLAAAVMSGLIVYPLSQGLSFG